MPLRKSTVTSHRPVTKDYWHAYGLQALSPDRFLRVVGKIIEGRFLLLAPDRSDLIHAQGSSPIRPSDEHH
jgi:hypothetical protein